MSTIPVWWLTLREDVPAKGYWDQQQLIDLFNGYGWASDLEFEDTFVHPGRGCVLIVPGRSHVDHAHAVREIVRTLPWCVLIVTGDEEHVFPWQDIAAMNHPSLKVWVQTPDPRWSPTDADGWLPVGWTPGTQAEAANRGVQRPFPWAFLGQRTHPRRVQCGDELRRSHTKGILVETPGFTQGLSHENYLRAMHTAQVAPCPSGPVCVDTFRVWEALQLGCVPVVDTRTPRRDETDYWRMLFTEQPEFPMIDEWFEWPTWLGEITTNWNQWATRVRAWWSRACADLETRLLRDIRSLAGVPLGVDDEVTVLITASPSPTHPSLELLNETIGSIRWHLPTAKIIVAWDGVRDEQRHLLMQYELARLAAFGLWKNVVFDVSFHHLHQANLAKRAMRLVTTPTVLFVEHDTPLRTELIEWRPIIDALRARRLNLVRFHHEAQIHPEHRWLMVDTQPRDYDGFQAMRTMQWSQRPHLADSLWYRRMLSTYFGDSARTMIEDTMHGVVDHAWRERGRDGADEWRLALYVPREGNMVRSYHSDARKGEEKYEMVFEYPDNEQVPAGAPWPTSRRTTDG